MNKIIYGDRTFEGLDIKTGSMTVENSLDGQSLVWDTLDVTVKSMDTEFFMLADSDEYPIIDSDGYFIFARPRLSDMSQYIYGDSLYYYHNDVLQGKFFVTLVRQVAPFLYKLSCVSGVGLLESTKHYGGLYSGALLKDAVANVISGVIEYSIDFAYQNIPIYGWLGADTRRKNLQQIIFANGLAIRKDASGIPVITALTDDSPAEIPDERLFFGGSIDYESTATGVTVTEHSWVETSGDEETTLFDGSVADESITTPQGESVQGAIITFDAPVHGLTPDGVTVIESGVNYAVLAPTTSGKLTGKKYTHITKIVKQPAPDATGTDNDIPVSDATLVNSLNSQNVADRVLAYYSVKRTITNDIVVGDEKPGDPVTLSDPFGGTATGMLKSLDIAMSGLLRGKVVVADAYSPVSPGNYYEHVVAITESGMFTVPSECKGKIKAALFSGGTGGYGGEKGKSGAIGAYSTNSYQTGPLYGHYTNNSTQTYAAGTPGDGGEPGQGAQGGKVYEVVINAEPGDTFSVSIGLGGAGADPIDDGSNVGADGGDTTFGIHSSSPGVPLPYGYLDPITGNRYGITGEQGTAGGSGSGDEPGGSVGSNTPGGTGADADEEDSWPNGGTSGLTDSGRGVGYGGKGGGAALGSNGNSGNDAYATASSTLIRGRGGQGGTGATPATPATTQNVPASGGNGGHGGGGGGAPGLSYARYSRSDDSTVPTPTWGALSPTPGIGGLGNKGGDGAPGLVLVYY